MKKKIFAAAICLCLIAGMLTGCGKKNPKEEFKNIMTEIVALRETEIVADATITIDPEKLTDELIDFDTDGNEETETVSASMKLNIAASYANKQAKADGEFALKFAGEEDMKAADTFIIVDGNKVYLNYKAFIEYIFYANEIKDAKYSDFFGKDFLCVELPNEDIWKEQDISSGIEFMPAYMDLAEEYPNAAKAVLRVINILKTKTNVASIYAFDGDNVVLTIDKDLIFSIIESVVNDADENRKIYADAVTEILWIEAEKTLREQGCDDETIEEQHQAIFDYSSEIEAIIPYIKTSYNELDKTKVPDLKLKLSVGKNGDGNYMVKLDLDFGELAMLKADVNFKKTEIAKITPPESVMTIDDLTALLTPDGITAIERKMILKVTDLDGTSKTMIVESAEPYFLDAVYDAYPTLLGLTIDEYGAIYIDSVDGVRTDEENDIYWYLYLNGEMSNSYALSSHGGVYEMRREQFIW